MNVFFDNCTAPVLASALEGYVRFEGHRAYHIKDVPGLTNGRHTSDLEWISHIKADSAVWIFITGDSRVLKNPAERAALRSGGLHGYVLAPAYQRTPMNQVAATLVWKWPEIKQVTELLAPPTMHEIPIGKNSKLRALPL